MSSQETTKSCGVITKVNGVRFTFARLCESGSQRSRFVQVPYLLKSFVMMLVISCGGGRVDQGFQDPADESAASVPALPAAAAAARPAVLVIRSDSCVPCRRTELAMLPAYAPFRDKVDLVFLDVTDDAHEAEALETARALGAEAFFLKNRDVTPSIALVSKSGRVRTYGGNTFGRRTWERTFRAMAEEE